MKPKLRSQPGEQRSLEAPHCSSYSMRLSLKYFGVLLLVASICRFVFFFYDKVVMTRTSRIRCNVTKRLSTVAREILSIMLAVFRILDKLHIFSNILCTCSIFIKM